MSRWDQPDFMRPDAIDVVDAQQLDALRRWAWRENLEPSWRQGCLRRASVARRTGSLPDTYN